MKTFFEFLEEKGFVLEEGKKKEKECKENPPITIKAPKRFEPNK